jgi:hypothetical protein
MTLTLLLVLAGVLETADPQTGIKPSGKPGSQPQTRGQKVTDSGVTQLQNKRTGVTCTLRILRIDPPVDPGMVATAPGTMDDPVARNKLSPCVE